LSRLSAARNTKPIHDFEEANSPAAARRAQSNYASRDLAFAKIKARVAGTRLAEAAPG
jgi:hypothetical protein